MRIRVALCARGRDSLVILVAVEIVLNGNIQQQPDVDTSALSRLKIGITEAQLKNQAVTKHCQSPRQTRLVRTAAKRLY